MPNLLEVRSLSKQFTSGGGPFRKARSMHAVNGVSFDLPQGRVIGVVGEIRLRQVHARAADPAPD